MKRVTKQVLFCWLLLFGSVCSLHAEERSDTVVFYFRTGNATYEPSYRGNAKEAKKLGRMFYADTTLRIKRLTLVGGSSLEGDYQANLQLAQVRAHHVLDILQHRYSWVFVDDRMPIELLTTTSKSMSEREARYKREDLRYVAVAVQYTDEMWDNDSSRVAFAPKNSSGVVSESVAFVPKVDSVSVGLASEQAQRDSVCAPSFDATTEIVRKPLFALKTNLLFDAATVLNLELEVPIGNRWSIAVEAMFPWWLWDSKQYCLQILGGTVEGRYWFGKRAEVPVLTGWFAGVYGGGGHYDIEWGSKGYQGEYYITAGLSAGYAHTINKRGTLRMEYALGIGFMTTRYCEYLPALHQGDWHLVAQQRGNYTWIGPTKAKISLVWLLNYGRKK